MKGDMACPPEVRCIRETAVAKQQHSRSDTWDGWDSVPGEGHAK